MLKLRSLSATWLRNLAVATVSLATWLGVAEAGATETRQVDLNQANQAELEMVKGIGPQLSGKILAERSHGRYASWTNFIARIRGIGPHQAQRLSNAGLRVDGVAYSTHAAVTEPASTHQAPASAP